MVRTDYLNAFLLPMAALTLVSCGPAETVEVRGPEVRDPVLIERVNLRPCPADDPGRQCEFDTVNAPEEMAAALRDDYQAQRNVAALQASTQPWIIARPIQACAWAKVALARRPEGSTYDDQGSVRAYCGALTGLDLTDAETLAAGIGGRLDRRASQG